MNSSLKNLLGVVMVAAIVVGTYVIFSVSQVYDRSSEPTNFRSFSVSGDGKATGTPDVATFSFQVITEGGLDVTKLQSENAAKMNGAIEYLKKEGIDAKDIKTKQYSVSPRYQSVVCEYTAGKVCPPATIVGYTVEQGVGVKVRDFGTISKLLSGVVTSGANQVSEIQFAIDNPTAVENMAREEAIAKAKEKAKSIATAGGFTLGRLLEISESSGGYSPYYARSAVMDMAGSKEAAVAPTIEAGSEEINISVSLKYEIR